MQLAEICVMQQDIYSCYTLNFKQGVLRCSSENQSSKIRGRAVRIDFCSENKPTCSGSTVESTTDNKKCLLSQPYKDFTVLGPSFVLSVG